jgi:GntR family transcriptional regulator
MNLEVDTHSPVPHYEQIRSQVAGAVLTGALTPGARLPTIRQLAGDLHLAVNTVARAYRELEIEGLVVTLGKKGTFVAERSEAAPNVRQDERRRVLRKGAITYAATAHSLGFSPDSAAAMLRKVMTTTATNAQPAE